MFLEGMKLPAKLQRHVANLSATVQVLLAEVILYAEGVEDRARTEGGKLDYAMNNQRQTELLNEQLKNYTNKNESHDYAIAVAASVGRATRDIADFLGLEYNYTRKRLLQMRKRAAQAWAQIEDEPQAQGEGASGAGILELFVEAQKRAQRG